jgi:hypothetical protein
LKWRFLSLGEAGEEKRLLDAKLALSLSSSEGKSVLDLKLAVSFSVFNGPFSLKLRTSFSEDRRLFILMEWRVA